MRAAGLNAERAGRSDGPRPLGAPAGTTWSQTVCPRPEGGQQLDVLCRSTVAIWLSATLTHKRRHSATVPRHVRRAPERRRRCGCSRRSSSRRPRGTCPSPHPAELSQPPRATCWASSGRRRPAPVKGRRQDGGTAGDTPRATRFAHEFTRRPARTVCSRAGGWSSASAGLGLGGLSSTSRWSDGTRRPARPSGPRRGRARPSQCPTTSTASGCGPSTTSASAMSTPDSSGTSPTW